MITVASVAALYLLVRFMWLILSRRRREERRVETSNFGVAFVAGLVLYNVVVVTDNVVATGALVAVAIGITVWEVRRRHSPPGDSP